MCKGQMHEGHPVRMVAPSPGRTKQIIGEDGSPLTGLDHDSPPCPHGLKPNGGSVQLVAWPVAESFLRIKAADQALCPFPKWHHFLPLSHLGLNGGAKERPSCRDVRQKKPLLWWWMSIRIGGGAVRTTTRACRPRSCQRLILLASRRIGR